MDVERLPPSNIGRVKRLFTIQGVPVILTGGVRPNTSLPTLPLIFPTRFRAFPSVEQERDAYGHEQTAHEIDPPHAGHRREEAEAARRDEQEPAPDAREVEDER
jgi:hypothetical protein